MVYCINPHCHHRQNPEGTDTCQSCATSLLIDGRFRLIKPLRQLNPRRHTDVFEVEVVSGSCQQVLKVLKAGQPKLIELMEREASILQLLQHPGIPKVYPDDYFVFTVFAPTGKSTQLHCLALEKFAGQNLEQWLQEHGAISQSLALNWLKQIVSILDHVHQAGCFHRDIKPSNIILQPTGELALIDFGSVRDVTETYLAKVSGAENTTLVSEPTDTTALISAGFSAPEQLNGKALPQSDFHALGRTFIQLMTGVHPNKLPIEERTGELIWKNKAPQIEQPLANFIDELTAHAPGKRPPNTRVILQRLEQIPFQSKLNRVVRSNFFKAGVAGLSLLLVFGASRVLLPWVASRLVEQGKKAETENRTETAQQDFQWAIQLNPQTKYAISSFYFERASRRIHYQPETAKKYYYLAINYNPNDVDAYLNLAFVCQKIKEPKCVIYNYEKALNLKPNTWEGHYGLGSFYDDQGQYDLASHQYELAIKSNGQQAVDAITNLARIKNKQGQYPQAVALSQQALSKTKDPGSLAASYKNIGWALLEQGRYKDAAASLQKATDLDVERADAYCLLAQAQEALDETKLARISWEACLIAKSNLPEVMMWKQEILQRLFGQ